MDQLATLQAKYDELVELFEEHEPEIREVQRRAARDVLQDYRKGTRLEREDSGWVEDYVQDTGAWPESALRLVS